MGKKHKAKGYHDDDKKTIKILVERKDVDRDSPLQMRIAGRTIDIKLDEPIVVPEFVISALMDSGIHYTEIHDEEVPEEDKELTKAEIVAKLVEFGVEHNPKDKKDVLMALFVEAEEAIVEEAPPA